MSPQPCLARLSSMLGAVAVLCIVPYGPMFAGEPVAEAGRSRNRSRSNVRFERSKRARERHKRARARRRAMRRPLKAYALDRIPRKARWRRRPPCAGNRPVPLVRYSGRYLKYDKPVLVPKAFRRRLERFEALVARTARAHYGRAPDRIIHMGTLHCRPLGSDEDTLSEHTFGNGIDISGFYFEPASPRQRKRRRLSRRVRRGFRVTVRRHWKPRRGARGVHSRFLHDLASRLIERPDIFRVLLGPAFPGHDDHFHFDCAPRREVAVFGWDGTTPTRRRRWDLSLARPARHGRGRRASKSSLR